MGMLRIVLRDGQIMHLDADSICVEKETGVLKLTNKHPDGNYGIVALFAPEVWAYYVFVQMEG